MAKFRATIDNGSSSVAKTGEAKNGIVTETNGWDVGVRVKGYVKDDIVYFDIFLTGGSHGEIGYKLIKTVSEKSVKRVKNKTSKNPPNPSNFLGALGAIMKMGELEMDTPKEQNIWKVRMLKAGIPEEALHMPQDWDDLSEEEKTKRLNKVIEVFKS